MRIIPGDFAVKNPFPHNSQDYENPKYHAFHDGTRHILSNSIEITDIKWRPKSWPDFIEYFNGRPDDMTPLELWEFGATSMLKALMELKEATK